MSIAVDGIARRRARRGSSGNATRFEELERRLLFTAWANQLTPLFDFNGSNGSLPSSIVSDAARTVMSSKYGRLRF